MLSNGTLTTLYDHHPSPEFFTWDETLYPLNNNLAFSHPTYHHSTIVSMHLTTPGTSSEESYNILFLCDHLLSLNVRFTHVITGVFPSILRLNNILLYVYPIFCLSGGYLLYAMISQNIPDDLLQFLSFHLFYHLKLISKG